MMKQVEPSDGSKMIERWALVFVGARADGQQAAGEI